MKAVQNVKEFLASHKPALSISRLPEKTKEAFKALAKAKYCDDYGWTLQALMDEVVHNDTLAKLLEEIRKLSERVASLEKTSDKPRKAIKTLSGKKLNEKVNDDEK